MTIDKVKSSTRIIKRSIFCALIFCVTLAAPAAAAPYPSLLKCRDAALQSGLDEIVDMLNLRKAVTEKRVSIALADITNLHSPRYADINGVNMMYAASLPKIAILFGLMKQVEEGKRVWDAETMKLAEQMIRVSSNFAATELLHRITPVYITSLLTSPAFRLYEPDHGGGLWIGKEYGEAPAWRRDPLKHLSHAATALHVARFYYLLETGRLVHPGLVALMKQILGSPGLNHKFARGLAAVAPHAKLYRKSGSWKSYHSDSAIVEHDGKRYILVALADDPEAAVWLEDLIAEVDYFMMSDRDRDHS